MFSHRDVVFLHLKDVIVVEEGLVTDLSGNVYQASITQHAEPEIARGLAAAETARLRGDLPVHHGIHVLCVKRGIGNYGHWMMEMLPRAYFGMKYLKSESLRYIVPPTNGPLGSVIESSLEMLGIKQSSLLQIGPQPRFFKEIVLIDGLAHHGVYMSPLVLECIDALTAQISAEYPDRLYVSRASVGFRNPTDEPDLRRLLESHGYFTISPGDLQLSRQIAFFKGARRVIGVMGAAMTNIAFCPLGTRIICLAPAGMPDTFFWLISNLRGLNYHEIRCTQTGPNRSVAIWDTDIKLDDVALRQLAFT